MAGAPKLTHVAPWVVGAVLVGAGVLAAARRAVPLQMSPRCNSVAECEPACEAGSPWACEQLGSFLWRGEGAPKNPERARELWARACDAGEGEACARLAEHYSGLVDLDGDSSGGASDDGGQVDPAGGEAARYLALALAAHQKSCERGFDESCMWLARRWHAGSVEEQAQAAALLDRLRPFWLEQCTEGNGWACLSMALVVDDDDFGLRDAEQAREFFGRACGLGRAVSCSLAGYRAQAADDEVAALEWFSRGCELNDAGSCIEAAALTTDEEARARLTVQRATIYTSQCDANYVEGCWSAAEMLVQKESVRPEDRAAARVFKDKEIALRERGCEVGAADDCASLAFTFRSGGLVERDVVRAERYAERACELGKKSACVSKREVLSNVSDASIGYHTCVVKTDGTVWCWGQNREGQLGDGTTVDRAYPVQARGLPKAKSIDSYGATSCIVSTNGEAWCWGAGFEGAERVDGGQAVSAVATGYELACALRANGDVGCSGYDAKNLALGASAVRASGLMRCAIANKKLVCWGSMMQVDVPEPRAVLERADVVDASVSGDGFCARFEAGDALCQSRALPDSPVHELKLEDARLIGGDADAGCAMRGDDLWCWYLRDQERKAPFRVATLPDVEKLIIRSYEGCALQRGGKLLCWYVFNPEPEPVSFELPP